MSETLQVSCWIDGQGPHQVRLSVASVQGRLCLSFRGGAMLDVFVADVDIDGFIESFGRAREPVRCVCKARDDNYPGRIGVGSDEARGAMLLHLELSDARAHTRVDIALTPPQAFEVRAIAVDAGPPRPRRLAPLLVGMQRR